MSTTTATHGEIRTGPSRTQVTTGWVITGLVTLFLSFDAVTHLVREAHVMEFNDEIGAPGWFPVVCGAVLTTCLVAYLVPRTRAIGTILITAYLGGACAIDLATETPAFNVVFAVGTAVLVWAGVSCFADRGPVSVSLATRGLTDMRGLVTAGRCFGWSGFACLEASVATGCGCS